MDGDWRKELERSAQRRKEASAGDKAEPEVGRDASEKKKRSRTAAATEKATVVGGG